MSQTSYSLNTANAFAGQIADIGPKTIRSYAAAEAIGFGVGLMLDRGRPDQCRLPFVNQVVLTESAALVAANSTTGTVSVTTIASGVPTTTTTNLAPVVFANSDAATLTALAAAIAAVPGVKSATAGNGTITVLAADDTSVLLSNFATTGGAGQPTWSYADSSADLFIGISVFEQSLENDLYTGIAQYPVGKPVNVLTMGRVYVVPEGTVAPGDPVYLRFASGNNGVLAGAFGNVADGGTCVPIARARWLDAIAAGSAGVLEVSLP